MGLYLLVFISVCWHCFAVLDPLFSFTGQSKAVHFTHILCFLHFTGQLQLQCNTFLLYLPLQMLTQLFPTTKRGTFLCHQYTIRSIYAVCDTIRRDLEDKSKRLSRTCTLLSHCWFHKRVFATPDDTWCINQHVSDFENKYANGISNSENLLFWEIGGLPKPVMLSLLHDQCPLVVVVVNSWRLQTDCAFMDQWWM